MPDSDACRTEQNLSVFLRQHGWMIPSRFTGIRFAILVLLATTLLCWESMPTVPRSGPAANQSHFSFRLTRVSTAPQADQGDSFPERDFNHGWRKSRAGWIQIRNYRTDDPIPRNLVQRLSPLFWAVTLWMFAILLLVLAS